MPFFLFFMLILHLMCPTGLQANPLKLVTPVSLQQELSFTPLGTWKRHLEGKALVYRHEKFQGRLEIGRITSPSSPTTQTFPSLANAFIQKTQQAECGYLPIAAVVTGGYPLTRAQGSLLCHGFSKQSSESIVELHVSIPEKALYRFQFKGPRDAHQNMIQELSLLTRTILVFELDYPPESVLSTPLTFRTLKIGSTTQQEAWNYLSSRPREYSRLKRNHFAISGELWLAQQKHRFILFFHHTVFCEIDILFEKGLESSHYSTVSRYLDQNYGQHSLNYSYRNSQQYEQICVSWLDHILQPLQLEKQWGADARARQLCARSSIVLGQGGYTHPLIFRLTAYKRRTLGATSPGSFYLTFRDVNLSHLFVQDWLYQSFRQQQQQDAQNRLLSEMF